MEGTIETVRLWFQLTGLFCFFFRVVLSSVLESRSSLSSSDKTNAWMQSGMDMEPQYTHTHTHTVLPEISYTNCNLFLNFYCYWRHARKHFSQAEGGQLDEVRQVMGMLAFPSDTHISPYKVKPVLSLHWCVNKLNVVWPILHVQPRNIMTSGFPPFCKKFTHKLHTWDCRPPSHWIQLINDVNILQTVDKARAQQMVFTGMI